MAVEEPNGVVTALAKLSEAVVLSYPIATKEEFRAQLLAHGPTVEFDGQRYDTEFGAKLIPSFFFPITDRADLVHKVTELLGSRGLLSDPSSHAH
ncbi:MAG TPA: hypothetical protein VGX49_11800 [Jatrophihabitans sp.]|jgi:hypothetical protein|nr:hypothetical protein [Jatrophihabitans sp.]